MGRRDVLFVLVRRVILFEPDLRFLANRELLFRKRGILAGKSWGWWVTSYATDVSCVVDEMQTGFVAGTSVLGGKAVSEVDDLAEWVVEKLGRHFFVGVVRVGGDGLYIGKGGKGRTGEDYNIKSLLPCHVDYATFVQISRKSCPPYLRPISKPRS